jgi:hypothetical protein
MPGGFAIILAMPLVGHMKKGQDDGSTPASSWLQSGPVELIPEKTRLEANRFRRTAWPREMLANVITLFASGYWFEINLALSSSAVPSL